MVFAGLYPAAADDYEPLAAAIARLALNDPSVSVRKETSDALGAGFRCGFLGPLHHEVFLQRLDQEHRAAVVSTPPMVRRHVRAEPRCCAAALRALLFFCGGGCLWRLFVVRMARAALQSSGGGGVHNTKRYPPSPPLNNNNNPSIKVPYELEVAGEPRRVRLESAAAWPRAARVLAVHEPTVTAAIVAPAELCGAVMSLCLARRGEQLEHSFLGGGGGSSAAAAAAATAAAGGQAAAAGGEGIGAAAVAAPASPLGADAAAAAAGGRALLRYRLPLAELATDFYSRLKTATRGLATLDYEFDAAPRAAPLVLLEILVNGKAVDALSRLVARQDAQRAGRALAARLRDLLERQLFEVTIQVRRSVGFCWLRTISAVCRSVVRYTAVRATILPATTLTLTPLYATSSNTRARATQQNAQQAQADGRVVARESLKARRKDVLAKCYGGDASRKRKLLEKQKEGKRRMRSLGALQVPADVLPKLMGAV